MASDVTEHCLENFPIIPKDNGDKGQESDRPQGLGVWMTALFIVSNVVGVSVLSSPKVLDNAGFLPGVSIFIAAALLAIYTASLLGKAWITIQERYSEFRGHVRFPYPAIAQVTYGKPGRLIVSFCMNLSLYGIAIVMIRLSSENIQDMCRDWGLEIPMFVWAISITIFLIPFTWFGTPADFWFVAVGAMVVNTVACVLLLINMAYDCLNQGNQRVEHSEISLHSTIEAVGKISYALAAHPTLPTLQNDMIHPRKFSSSVYISFAISMVMYLSVSIAAYFVYGDAVQENVLLSVSHGPALYIVQTLVTSHLLLGFIVISNPVAQEIEELLGIPKEFGWKRCLSRTTIDVCVTIIAVSVPSFGVVLGLVGGSSMILLAFVFPLIFYLRLDSMEGDWQGLNISPSIKVFIYITVALGIILCIICTYSALVDLFSSLRDMTSNDINITTHRNIT